MLTKQQPYGDSFENYSTTTEQSNLEQYVSWLLTTIGIMPHCNGYRYLKVATILCSCTALPSVTHDLYPVIARIFKTKETSVERCIRHCICSAFNRGALKRINDILGVRIVEEYHLTNSELIALLAELLSLKFDKDIASAILSHLIALYSEQYK